MSHTRSDRAHSVPVAHSLSDLAPAAGERAELSPSFQTGLRALWEGYRYADGLGRDRWEFAVEMEFLRAAGLNNNDLRWLLAKGYLDHAQETTAPGCTPRRFRRGKNLPLRERSSFVLTDAGVTLARAVLAVPEPNPPAREAEPPDPNLPRWDAATHSLYFQGRLVKHFKHEAPIQEAILEAFQVSNWSRFVVVTLPKEESVNPKESLRCAIRNLNNRSEGRLRFTQEGNGGRVGWHPAV